MTEPVKAGDTTAVRRVLEGLEFEDAVVQEDSVPLPAQEGVAAIANTTSPSDITIAPDAPVAARKRLLETITPVLAHHLLVCLLSHLLANFALAVGLTQPDLVAPNHRIEKHLMNDMMNVVHTGQLGSWIELMMIFHAQFDASPITSLCPTFAFMVCMAILRRWTKMTPAQSSAERTQLLNLNNGESLFNLLRLLDVKDAPSLELETLLSAISTRFRPLPPRGLDRSLRVWKGGSLQSIKPLIALCRRSLNAALLRDDDINVDNQLYCGILSRLRTAAQAFPTFGLILAKCSTLEDIMASANIMLGYMERYKLSSIPPGGHASQLSHNINWVRLNLSANWPDPAEKRRFSRTVLTADGAASVARSVESFVVDFKFDVPVNMPVIKVAPLPVVLPSQSEEEQHAAQRDLFAYKYN